MREKEEITMLEESGISRRKFLQAAGTAAAAGAAVAALSGCTTEPAEEESVAPEQENTESSVEVVTTELDIPLTEEPTTTSYECDVVVVGGGWAGVSACRGMAEQGYSVVLVDKAYPGWSGLSAWSNSFHWFEPEWDDAELDIAAFKVSTDYTSNINWVKLWIEKSKEAYEKTSAWGALEQYENASNADPDYNYARMGDAKGYLQDYVGIGVGSKERHWAFAPAIQEVAEMVPYTMITDVIVDGGRVVGAVGFNVRSATVVSFACKAVIMCTGPGCYKPSGYPTGSSTWDGDYIGYNLGLQIGGKEWSDFHSTSNGDTGNVYMQWVGHHIQCNWPTVNEGMHNGSLIQWKVGVWDMGSIDGATQYDPYPAVVDDSATTGPVSSTIAATVSTASATAITEEEVEEDNGDIRADDYAVGFTGLGKGTNLACGIAAPGLSIHKSEGVFTGNEATTATSIPGLYYAGDALAASPKGGVYYGKGFSSNMSCTQGYFAAEEAGVYVATAQPGYITDAVLAEQTETILTPITLNTTAGKGFDPCWLRDQLSSLMTPAHISTWKTAAQLEAALTMVEYMRDVYVPKLAAIGGHELRMCWEMKSRVLNAEMRLRACLAREESRGRHYRADFPYRDDENFLCSIVLSKTSDGTMQVEKIPYDADWVGDLTVPYELRYQRRFPGEADALGIEDTELSADDWLATDVMLLAGDTE